MAITIRTIGTGSGSGGRGGGGTTGVKRGVGDGGVREQRDSRAGRLPVGAGGGLSAAGDERGGAVSLPGRLGDAGHAVRDVRLWRQGDPLGGAELPSARGGGGRVGVRRGVL